MAQANNKGGTPKIVPVLVSMGVAAGTFCGLYFGLGTKKDEAAADPAGEVAAADDEGSDTPTPTAGSDTAAGAGSDTAAGAGSDTAAGSGSDTAAGSGSDTAAGSGSDTAAGSGAGSGSDTVAAGSGSDTAAGSGSGSGAAAPMMTDVTLQFSSIPTDAEIEIDGVKVANGMVSIPLTNGSKKIKITASAKGYRSYEKVYTITEDQVISFKMAKRSGSSSSGSRSGPGDKIDLGKIDM